MKLKTDSEFIISVIEQVRKDYSPIILICGKQRRGKSNMALAISNILMNYFHKKQFNPETNLFFDPLDMIERMEEAKKEPLIVDEAGVFLNAQEFYSHLNIAMNKIIQSQAYLNNIYILVLPLAKNLAKAHREFVNFRVLMLRRGYARIHKMKIYYEDFEDIKKRKKIIFLEHFEHPFVNGNIWDKYKTMAEEKKTEIRGQIKDYLTAIKSRGVWFCPACNTENPRGFKRCTRCLVPRSYTGG